MILPPSDQILHSVQSKQWFNSRCQPKAKMQYLKSQREIMNDNVVTHTFRLIDKDQSKTLEIEELYSMFLKNGYPININLLRGFFEKADKDNNKSIELEEFKHVMYDEQATQSFREMMRKMREQAKESNYYSTDFVRLLRYLSYCQDRNALQFQINNHRLTVEKRSKLLSQLIQLNHQFNQDQQITDEQLQVKPYKKQTTEKKTLPPINQHYVGNSNPSSMIQSQLKLNLSDVHKNSSLFLPPYVSPQNTDRNIKQPGHKYQSYLRINNKIFSNNKK
ncbi:unnamed protein product (macronuclear) [Paramecium tetraurelia]|uniref:EF-hand domain-containing protein n=1 Tax=Paramecium tetraurelia TaxID=5888 RepID=A0C7W8_PARTE|nr:uncharacterized protein GSPATT00036016001 [Paramecium tetraurelia]CAK66885.1 unnamed protein product [Paramecium tetraurelia]|eukprot:XP_001434282.1 hypothetical protein (macronuclear) [Paramecium tetraurelia strain d4-2]